MNHPIDSLGKLRIVDLKFIGSTCTMELDYLSGMSETTLSYISSEDRFFIFDHYDRYSNTRHIVEFIIEENRESLVKYINQLMKLEETG